MKVQMQNQLTKSLIPMLGVLYGLFFSLDHARAEILYWPLVSEGGSEIEIVNTSHESTVVWMQYKNATTFEEKAYQIPARGTILLNEKELRQQDADGNLLEYAWKTQDPIVVIRKKIGFNQSLLASNQVSIQQTFDLTKIGSSLSQNIKLKVLNLNYGPQVINISFFNNQKLLLASTKMSTQDYFLTQDFKASVPLGTRYIEMTGQGRMHARLWSDKFQSWLTSPQHEIEKIQIPQDKKYFLLANSDRTDSFVIALEDKNQIEQARYAITHPESELIVFGRIRKDQKSWNRPLLNPQKSSFSWTVSEVTQFAQLASISCDGSPSLVEEQLPQWLNFSRICFWNFRLIQELSPEQVEKGVLK